ncbi:MAG: hypothetical protein AAFN42_14060 [Cyanobacteria bacterium J06554_1]
MHQDSTDIAFKYTFTNGQTAYILDAPDTFTYQQSLDALGLTAPSPSMVIIGGASKMSSESKARVSELFTKVLAPIAETYGVTVFDGGTEAGVIQMMGEARKHIDGTFPLVGVAPKVKVRLPGYVFSSSTSIEPNNLTNLERHHTHFALIPGVTWGSESPWLAHCASILASHCPSITILINGGKISLSDLILNLSVGRQTIIIAGSGRLADEIANTINGTKSSDKPMIQELAKSYYPEQLSSFELCNSLDILTKTLKSHFNSSAAT